MYLTEEEARTKWCSESRMEGNKGGAWNRTMGLFMRLFGWTEEEVCNCIASECMMWWPPNSPKGHCGHVKQTYFPEGGKPKEKA